MQDCWKVKLFLSQILKKRALVNDVYTETFKLRGFYFLEIVTSTITKIEPHNFHHPHLSSKQKSQNAYLCCPEKIILFSTQYLMSSFRAPNNSRKVKPNCWNNNHKKESKNKNYQNISLLYDSFIHNLLLPKQKYKTQT